MSFLSCNRSIVVVLFLLMISNSVMSLDLSMTWNVGSIDNAWNHFAQDIDGVYHGQKFSLSLVDVQYHSKNNLYGVGLSLLQYRKDWNTDIFSFFPYEIYYNFFANYDVLLGLYGRGETLVVADRINPYFEGGIKIGLFSLNKTDHLKYSWRNSIYIGIDNSLDIQIGTQIDIGSAALLALIIKSKSYDDEI